jgi:hypothetical protein
MRSRVGDAKQVVIEVTGQLARLAEAQLADARRVLTNARRALARGRTRPTGRLRALVDELQTTIQRSQRLLDQAHTRLGGGMPDGASRLVSLHDPDARPIRKGRDCYLGLLLPAPVAGRRDAIAGTPDHHTALARIVEALLRERRTVNPPIAPTRYNFFCSSSRPVAPMPPTVITGQSKPRGAG